MRMLPLLIAALISLPATAASPVVVGTMQDGTVISYDPATRLRDGNLATISYEYRWASPKGCKPDRGCIVITKATDQFDCSNYRRTRLSGTDVGEGNKVLWEGDHKARLVLIPDNDETGRALFNAACGSKRKAG